MSSPWILLFSSLSSSLPSSRLFSLLSPFSLASLIYSSLAFLLSSSLASTSSLLTSLLSFIIFLFASF